MADDIDFWVEDAPRSVRPDWLYAWFSDRKIGARVVDKFNVSAGRWIFDKLQGEADAVMIPLTDGGDVVTRRCLSRRQAHSVLTQSTPAMFNAAALASPEVVWASDEMDVLALAECGLEAISVTDLNALTAHAKALGAAKKIILCCGDSSGAAVKREELARRLGRHRCWLVTWPDGLKDAAEVLAKRGSEIVQALIQAAEPYPIEGLQRVRPGVLRALRRLPPPATMTTGTRATDAILKLPTEGRLIVITGYPGSGKTSWVRFVMVHSIENHDRRWAVFSPEMQPWEQFVAECSEVWAGKPFWPVPGVVSMSDAEIDKAEAWMGDKITMIVADAVDDAPTVDWLLERASAAILRDGVTDFWIDPWNQVDHSRAGGITETEYTGRQLQRLSAFGLRHGCNVWINVHPKMPQTKPGDAKGSAPGPYDISGSSHWFNRADIGVTVHSPGADQAEVHLWKARFVRRWGKKGASAALDFDILNGRYRTPDAPWPGDS